MGPIEILNVIVQGGPAVLSAVLFFMWYLERKERTVANAKLLEVSMAMIEQNVATKAALEKLSELIDRWLNAR